MTQIEIIGLKRFPSYVEINYKMTFTLPAAFGTGISPVAGIKKIVASYDANFEVETIPVVGTVITKSLTKSFNTSVTTNGIAVELQLEYATIRATLDALTLQPYDTAIDLIWDGNAWTPGAAVTDNPVANDSIAVTGTGAAGAAVTVTLPAAPDKFHEIYHLSISLYSTAARTGNANPVLVSTTNINGSLAITFPSAGTIGSVVPVILEPVTPIKSAVANTATTIVCPATTNVIWRVNVIYKLV